MAGAPTPDVIITPFGVNASGVAVPTLPIPVPSQLGVGDNIASFNDGFPPDTMTPEGSGGVPMRGPDMQGILYMITWYLQALTGGQFWAYNSTWESANSGYALGAVLAMANGAGLWINTSSGNANNPDTTAAASSDWVPLYAVGTTAITGLTNSNVTLTAPQAASPILTLAGTLTGNVQIVLPPWAAPQRWRVYNNTTGSYTVTLKTASGSGVIVPQFGSSAYVDVASDGTNIIFIDAQGSGSFTATLVGVSGSVTGTINWQVDSKKVTLYVPIGSYILGTATGSTQIYLTGVPSYLLTGANGTLPLGSPCGIFYDNLLTVAAAAVSSAGQITLQVAFTGGDAGTAVYNNFSGPSGYEVGLPGGWNITYPWTV